jgi:phosphohistidine phosphatase
MKKLYLVRHAKSSWDDYSLEDAMRPLNDRGSRDAPAMAKILSDRAPQLSWLITSHAKRAKSTAARFRKALHLDKNKLVKDARLYHASPAQIINVIKDIDNEIDEVALFGHNPGMTDFLNRYTDGFVDNMPTCGIAILSFDINNWNEVDSKIATMTDFLYPKMFGLL